MLALRTHLGDIVCCDWEEVDFVCQSFGGLDGGNVGVDQNCLDIFLLQGLDSLDIDRYKFNYNTILLLLFIIENPLTEFMMEQVLPTL